VAKKKGGDALDFVSLMEQTLVLSAAKKLLEWFPSSGKEAAHKSNEPSQPIAGAVKHPDQRNSPHTSHTAMAEPVKEGPSGNNPLGFEVKDITYHRYLESREIWPRIGGEARRRILSRKGSDGQ
jgi:hypothetical protein